MKKITEKVLELEQSALDNKKIINSEGAEISVTKDKYILLGSNGLNLEFEKQTIPLLLQCWLVIMNPWKDNMTTNLKLILTI